MESGTTKQSSKRMEKPMAISSVLLRFDAVLLNHHFIGCKV